MKKSLIALAVAGAFAAPAFAATSNVDVYGQVMFSTDYVTIDTAAAGDDESDIVTGVNDVTRIGFKGSEDLGGGMKAVWQIETQMGSALGNRNSFVGLAGGFGTVVMGTHDTPYKLATGKLDPFSDTIGDYNAIIGRTATTAGSAAFDLRAGNVGPGTIAYISPNFSGFHAAIAYVGAQSAEAAGTDNTDALSVMGMYDNGPLFASLAYESHSNVALATATNEIDAWKLGLGYTFGDTKVGFVYEDIEHDAAANANSREAWYVSLSHAMGPIVLKAAYGSADNSDAVATKGADFFALGADYNLSKRTSVFGIYASTDNDAGAAYGMGSYAPAAGSGLDVDGFSIGIKHSF